MSTELTAKIDAFIREKVIEEQNLQGASEDVIQRAIEAEINRSAEAYAAKLGA